MKLNEKHNRIYLHNYRPKNQCIEHLKQRERDRQTETERQKGGRGGTEIDKHIVSSKKLVYVNDLPTHISQAVCPLKSLIAHIPHTSQGVEFLYDFPV